MKKLDISKNWNNREEWLATKKFYYDSKTVLQLNCGRIDFDPNKQKRFSRWREDII